MKILTKEWVKDFDFLELMLMLKPNSNKKIPFVFTNGGTENVANEDLRTVKTNFNFTEKDNELNFVMLPDTFNLESYYFGNGKIINEKICRQNFLYQYLNRLRVISYLPDNILKLVKDKRLLALGYAEKEAKKEIYNYIRKKYRKAVNLLEKSNKASVNAETDLTIHWQLKKHSYIHSVPFLFDQAEITEFKQNKTKIYLMLDDKVTVFFSGAKIIENEVDILQANVCAIELYKKEKCYELHLLIKKIDENFIENYYYVTYGFKNLIIIN